MTSGSFGAGSSHPHRGRRRRRQRVLIALLAIVLLVLGLDRIAAVVTEHRLAHRIQTQEHLAATPHVKIRGVPFVAQVLRGRYGTVELTAGGAITARGVRIDGARATLHGVRVSLSDAVHGTVTDVPVKSGRGSAVVPYSSVNAAVKEYGGEAGSLVTVAGDGAGQAELEGPVGLSVGITAKVSGGRLVITPSARDLESLPDEVSSLVTQALASPVPLPDFPFNIVLATGSFQPDGLHLTARARDSVFPVR